MKVSEPLRFIKAPASVFVGTECHLLPHNPLKNVKYVDKYVLIEECFYCCFIVKHWRTEMLSYCIIKVFLKYEIEHFLLYLCYICIVSKKVHTRYAE